MKDINKLRQELDEHKQLSEYRLSRPSDISGNRKLKGGDMRSLMTNIKKRIQRGEKRQRIVKDELVKFWKKKGLASRDKVLKQIKERDTDVGA